MPIHRILGFRAKEALRARQGDETTDRVLRLLAEIAVAHCLASELPLGGPRPGALNFIAVDAFVRLLCTLIRCALPLTLASGWVLACSTC